MESVGPLLILTRWLIARTRVAPIYAVELHHGILVGIPGSFRVSLGVIGYP